LPPGIQFGTEIVCWALFMTVLVGSFGEDDMAAGWAVMRYMHFSFMPAVGFSVATTSLVGKWIGAGRPDLAVSRTRVGLALAVSYMSVCAIVFIIFRHQLISVFVSESVDAHEAAEIIRIGGLLMLCGAFFQTVDAVGILYTGALRGAGDTLWPGIVQVVLVWVVMIGGGALLTKWAPGLESVGPWLAAMVYLLILGVFMGVRFERGRWRQIDLLGLYSRGLESAPLGPAPPSENAAGAVRDLFSDPGRSAPLEDDSSGN
jgi:MATE family multidrug resistance protein